MCSNYLSRKKYFQANLINFRANFPVQQSESLSEKQVCFTLKTILHHFKQVVKRLIWLYCACEFPNTGTMYRKKK